MMPLTLREVLDLDAVRRGEPRVAAGAGRLGAAVRWVHAAELPDVGRLLRGGELLLSTGIALPDSAEALAAYAASLTAAGVTGLAIELGHRFTTALPAPLVAAAAARDLPLIELRREVPFVEITEAVHARIIDELLIERAAATLALGRLLTSQAESLERQAHRTLISAIIERADVDLSGAEARARAMGVPVTGRTLVAAVVRLPDAANGTSGDLGPAPGRPATVLGTADVVAAACRAARVPALTGALDDVRAGVLLSLPPGADPDGPLRAIAARLTAHPGGPPTVIGVAAPADSLPQVRAAFLEAREVADAAIRQARADRGQPRPRHGDGAAQGRAYYRLPDLRLRGLVHALRDDPRLRAFAERELGPLAAHDTAHGTTLLADLATYLNAGGNKALAAERAHLARPTFYQRLRLIERVLGVSLADPESRAALHVALLINRTRHTLLPDEITGYAPSAAKVTTITRIAFLITTAR